MKNWLILVILLAACVPASARKARKLEGKYNTGDPGKGWAVVPPGGADWAWFNKQLGSSIYTDSNCGSRYGETRIEDLATELIAGFRKVELVKEEYRTIDGREGLLRVHTGTLDGVAIEMAMLVVNKNACNYDLLYISPPDVFEEGWASYERVIGGFKEL